MQYRKIACGMQGIKMEDAEIPCKGERHRRISAFFDARGGVRKGWKKGMVCI